MQSRALQLVLMMTLGLGLGLLLTHHWQSQAQLDATAPPDLASPSPDTAKTEGSGAAPAASSSVAASTPSHSFKLPKMAASAAPPPAPVHADRADNAPPPPEILVPAGWLLRGSAPQNYELRSDRDQVWRGNASALLKSHDNGISPRLYGSLMQTAIAEPYIGKRVEFSAYLRAEDVRSHSVAVWFRAIDPNGLLLMAANSWKSSPDVTEEWKRFSVVVDVPWAATEVAYGLSLQGKGAAWIDDAKLEPVDKASVPLTDEVPLQQRGLAVQMPRERGPLANPTNLGFEEVVRADATLRTVPKDSIAESRF